MQIVCFILFPSAYSAAFAGCKYIFAQIGLGEWISLTPLVKVLLGLLLFTILFGRFFCGFACAFGSLGDGVHFLFRWIFKKLKRKPLKLPEIIEKNLYLIKYFVLVFYLGVSYLGIADKVAGFSPWTVFSQLHELRFNLTGYIGGVILFVLILIGMCLSPRFFCKALCPMGAVFSIMPVLPFSTLRRHEETCIRGCSACSRTCPVNVELPYDKGGDTRGECIQCQKCVGICPRGNVDTGKKLSQPVRVVIILAKCLILISLFVWLGV